MFILREQRGVLFRTDKLQEEMTMECIKTFVVQMEKMGYAKEQIIELLKKYISEN